MAALFKWNPPPPKKKSEHCWICLFILAVIGGGISGVSSAYYLRELFGSSAMIDLYEPAAELGGRLANVEIGGKHYEAGGSILHPENRYMLNFTKLLGMYIAIITLTGYIVLTNICGCLILWRHLLFHKEVDCCYGVRPVVEHGKSWNIKIVFILIFMIRDHLKIPMFLWVQIYIFICKCLAPCQFYRNIHFQEWSRGLWQKNVDSRTWPLCYSSNTCVVF